MQSLLGIELVRRQARERSAEAPRRPKFGAGMLGAMTLFSAIPRPFSRGFISNKSAALQKICNVMGDSNAQGYSTLIKGSPDLLPVPAD